MSITSHSGLVYVGQLLSKTHVSKRLNHTALEGVGTPEFLAQSIRYAKQIKDQPIWVRLDSGNDSKDNIEICHAKETQCDSIIKRNIRQESREEWLEIAKKSGICCEQREGKMVYIGETSRYIKKLKTSVRVVFEITERTIDKTGTTLSSMPFAVCHSNSA